MSDTPHSQTLPGSRVRYREGAGELVLYLPRRPGIGWTAAVLIVAALLACLGFIGVVGYHLGWFFLPIGLFMAAIALFVLGFTFLAFTQRYLTTKFVYITRASVVVKTVLWGREEVETHQVTERSVARLYWGDPRLLRRSGDVPSRPQGVQMIVDKPGEDSSPVFGDGLSWGEQQWIAWRINRFLGRASDADAPEGALTTADMAPAAIEGLPDQPLPPPEGMQVRIEEGVSGTQIIFPNTMEMGSRKGIASVLIGGVWAAGAFLHMFQSRHHVTEIVFSSAMALFGLLVLWAGLTRLFGRSRMKMTPEKITFSSTLLGIGPWASVRTAEVISVKGSAIRSASQRIRFGNPLRDATRNQTEVDWLIGEVALRIQAARSGTSLPSIRHRRRERASGRIEVIGKSPTGTIPYDIHRRPMPSGSDLNTLLPVYVAPFRREPFEEPGEVGSGPIYVEYRSDDQHAVFIELGVCADSDDARHAVAVAQTEAHEPGDAAEFSPNTEPSFYRMITPKGAFMAWSRGNYFFSASLRADKSEETLDRFMDAFPY